jgi:hypothetical protein
MVALVAQGQGTVSINNRVGTEITARFVLAGEDPLVRSSIGSPDYTVQFLGGPVGTPTASLQPLSPPGSGFRGAAGTAAAGYLNLGYTGTVPGVPAGGNADVLVRLMGPGGFTQDFGPFRATGLGGDASGGAAPPLTPPNLAMGTTALQVVPEPTTLALGALGLGALLLFRRRK